MVTQTERILRHLKDHGSINPLEALREYGIMRLASRVSDLKRLGYPIDKSMKKSTNKYGETVHYAVYTMEEISNDQ